MVELQPCIRGRTKCFSLILGQRDKYVPSSPDDQMYEYEGIWNVYQHGSIKKIKATPSQIPRIYYRILEYIESKLILNCSMSVFYTRQPIKNIKEFNQQYVWENQIEKFLEAEINNSLSRRKNQ